MQQRLGPSPESSQWCQPTKCYRYLEGFYLRLWNEHYKYPLKLVIFFSILRILKGFGRGTGYRALVCHEFH